MGKKITIIIPNINGEAYLKKCLESLKKQTFKDFSIIFIDNGSTDKSVELAMQYGDSLNLTAICYDCNYGFAKAVNEGIHMADTPYVLLLNNDVIAGKHLLQQLYFTMEENPDVFSVQALMLQKNDPHKVDSAGDCFSAMGWANGSLRDRSVSLVKKQPKEIFSACGGAALYRREVFREIGDFDEEYFAYLEDVDLGYRARLAGYRNILSPRAKALHIGSASTGGRYNSFKVQLSARNALLTCYKNMPSWQIALNAIPILMGIFIKLSFFTAKGFGRDYIEGVFSAIGKIPAIERVDFREIPDERIWEIQKELWKNVFRRFL